jgi:hypothetical protein
VPEFLSPAWFDALDEATRAVDGLTTTGDALVVEQRVHAVPGRGDVVYHLVIDGDGARVVVGQAESPTVVVETDHTTAVALALGTLNAQSALAAGRWRLHGTTGRLASHAALLQSIGDAFASLRSRTTFPGTP